jgi:L(+)-tartrate dehydratase alpha subunit
MFENLAAAEQDDVPSCQDTGVIQYFVECGSRFPLIGQMRECLTQATKRATKEAPLRHNAVEIFVEKNSGNNTGVRIPYIDWEIIPDSDECTIYGYMAGGGCSLPGAAKVLMPVEGYEGIVRFVFDVICERGINACPPLLVGIGIAGSCEVASMLSKRALMRPIGSHNDNANAAKMEKLLEDGINAIGLGPQGMGGKFSVMGVNIENTARHPSAIGVAVNVGCWSHRRGHIVFDKDLNFTIDTHTGFEYKEA